VESDNLQILNDTVNISQDTNEEIVSTNPVEPIRRSARIAEKQQSVPGSHKYHPAEWFVNLAKKEIGLHISITKGLERNAPTTIEAIVGEMWQHILDKRSFHPIYWTEKPKGFKSIRSHMFLKEKFDARGLFKKMKARLVGGGNTQDRSLYESVSSPTVSISAAFIIASIAAKENRYIATADVTGAYLNAKMKADVYMTLDKQISTIACLIEPGWARYKNKDDTLLVKLDKALYGCIESAQLWYEELSGFLISLGFIPNPYDPCIFNKTTNNIQTTIVLYVDDLMITSTDASLIEEILNDLVIKYKTLSITKGKVHSYLGMLFDFTTAGELNISMDGFMQDVLREYEVSGNAKTPATDMLFNIQVGDKTILNVADTEKFHSRVAKLLYLAKRIRPDIMTAVAFLTTRVRNPDQSDLSKLDRVLRYLNTTKNKTMKLKIGNNLSIYAYVDASFAVHADMKSHTGVIITIGNAYIYGQSTKQKLMTKSSTEAELVALSDSLPQIIWTRNFVLSQNIKINQVKLYEDNESTIRLIQNGRSTSARTRHIDIRYFLSKIESTMMTLI
jgi:hypothetical protein